MRFVAIALVLFAAVVSALWLAPWLVDEVPSLFSRQPVAGARLLGHGASWNGQTYQGFLTTGCGDSFVYSPSGGTWRVEAEGSQLAELKKLKVFSDTAHLPWATTRLELEGRWVPVEARGFFGKHVGILKVRRVLRRLTWRAGDTTAIAAAPKKYVGYLIAGPEATGFASIKSKDELWYVVPGKLGWDQLFKSLGPAPNLQNVITYLAYVEIIGRVGPPGALIDYEREISMDGFRYLRPMRPGEMDDTALVQGLPFDGKGRGGARFNHCLQPLEMP